MTLTLNTITNLTELLGAREASDVIQLARWVDRIEKKWVSVAHKYTDKMTIELLTNARATGRIKESLVDFGPLLMTHAHAVMKDGILSTFRRTPVRVERLAAPPKGEIPKSLKELRKWWDKYRKGDKIAPRQREMADKIKATYLKAIHEAWLKHSEDFLSGDAAGNTEAIAAIMEKAQIGFSRAKMTVETETTYYFNKARREIYDQSDDVTHYLFMAIRDHRTTKWCKTRHGLVYAKGDPLLDKETPPCFTPETPVLTMDGWKPISTVTVGEYVWTHKKRWRRIEKIHNTPKKSLDLFQIGFALATSNHPYFERGIGFVEAERFRTEKGLWTSSLGVPALLSAGLDAVVKARSEILLKFLSRYYSGSYSKARVRTQLARWKEEAQGRLFGDAEARTSQGESTGLCFGTCCYCGRVVRSVSEGGRSCPSHQPNKNGQPSGEPPGNDQLRSPKTACKIRWSLASEVVFNLDVEEDSTYYAGGFLVHNCHWYCRSEMIPLTPANPNHAKLIKAKRRWRRENSPEPLPREWTATR